ncbi:MAG: hypothetical protein WDN08_21795 [Rhizomicrobium sp.]
MRKVGLLALTLAMLSGGAASASPWSVTVFGGPVTYTIFTETLHGEARFNSGMIGIAVDRRLAYLGWGWNLIGEAQVQQFAARDSKDFYEGSGNYTSIALGLGVEYHHFPWDRSLPTAVSVFMGPSYAFNPPLTYRRDQWGSRKNLLNYLGIEFAFALVPRRNLDAVVRVYHRSGVWGIYTNDANEASSIGVGLRYRF